jgi:hypothetical protein
MQAAILWSVNQPFFGLRPALPMRVLYVQAENDYGDLYEIRNGICEGLNLNPSQVDQAGENIRIANVNDAIGDQFTNDVLRPLLREHHPDLLILDPLLAYIGGDITRQDAVSKFIRLGLQPAISETNSGLLLVHHPPKPRRDTGESKSSDDAYIGAGSADLANWARGIIVLKPTPHHGIYNLRLAKRGQRAGWVEADGYTTCYEREIVHGKGGLIYWREAESGERFKTLRPDKTKSDLLALIPITGTILKSVWVEKAKSLGIGEKRACRILDNLEEESQIFVSQVPRLRARPAVAISRQQQLATST